MNDPLVLRPATPADADAIWEMLAAAEDTTGMTSLPGSPGATDALCAETGRTVGSLAAGSFHLDEGQRRRLLFVAVRPTGANGTDGGDGSGREPVVGLSSVTFKSAVPNLAVRVETSRSGCGLVMHSQFRPWTRTELGSTYLAPTARRQGHGTLVSRGRLMLIHKVSSLVPTTIASHLRGLFDDDGTAPFWTCFGRHFAPQWLTSPDAEAALEEDPANLEKLSGLTLALDAPVLESLGAVNTASLPAYRLLLAEGLEPTGMFDPIDGGPTVVGQLAGLATRSHRRHGRVVIDDTLPDQEGLDALISNTSLDSFRVTRGRADTSLDGTITIDAATAARLGVGSGSLIAASPLVVES